jgi:hypothetical protein
LPQQAGLKHRIAFYGPGKIHLHRAEWRQIGVGFSHRLKAKRRRQTAKGRAALSPAIGDRYRASRSQFSSNLRVTRHNVAVTRVKIEGKATFVYALRS